MEKNEAEEILWKILQKQKRPISPEEFVEISGFNLNTIRRTLGKMVKDRQLKRAGGGKFVIARNR